MINVGRRSAKKKFYAIKVIVLCFQIPTPCNALKCLTAWLNSFWHWINLKSYQLHKHWNANLDKRGDIILKTDFINSMKNSSKTRIVFLIFRYTLSISQYILITVSTYIPSRRVHIKTFLTNSLFFRALQKGSNLRKLNLNYLSDNRVEFSLPTEYSLCLCISTFS